ncbi:NADP-dependent malic enzyme [Entomospira entomophila]|nr:NADP-dependent malic enzyme [Entomospira entomophilus]
MMDIYQQSLNLHKTYQGKYRIESKIPIRDFQDLSVAYSPGVAAPCRAIAHNKEDVYTYTSKGSTIAVISDGSAVLGLGNIGPEAALPVMEGKAILFKEFADINAIPLCLATQDTEEIIRICKALAPSLGGINLEDISSPRCFEIEERLKAELDIPVFHDDQHGTAIVVAAAIINANRLSGRQMKDLRVVINGLGAAGVAIAQILHDLGIQHIIGLNSKGVVHVGNPPNSTVAKLFAHGVLVDDPNKHTLSDAMADSNVFIGVSVGNVVTPEMVQSMQEHPYIFAMANPDPEIMPDLAKNAGALVVGTGRSDFPNQINNVLAFPGIFHGALHARAKQITNEMKLAAAHAIANIISDSELKASYIIPGAFDERVVPAVSQAVQQHIMP